MYRIASFWLLAVFVIGGGAGLSGQGEKDRQVLLENDRVLVREVVLQPGIEYAEHTHSRPHVGVIVRGGKLEFHEAGRVETVEFEDGDAGWRDAGVRHRIVNRSSSPVHVVEVELK